MKYIYSDEVQERIDYGYKVIEEHDKILQKKIKSHVDKLGMEPWRARKAFISERLELIALHARFISAQLPIGVAL